MTICLSLRRKRGHSCRMTLKEGELHIMAGLHSYHCWQKCSCEPSNTLLIEDDTTLKMNFKNEISPEISTLSHLSIHPSIYLSIYNLLSIYLPIYNLLSIYQPIIYLLSIYLSILSIYQPIIYLIYTSL